MQRKKFKIRHQFRAMYATSEMKERFREFHPSCSDKISRTAATASAVRLVVHVDFRLVGSEEKQRTDMGFMGLGELPKE